LIFPMFLMVLLTFIIGVVAMLTRLESLRSGNLKMGYFKLMEGQNTPERVILTTRCFNNMFEVPVLFYAAGVLSITLGVESLPALTFAWLFVALRYLQALVHLTSNSLLIRMSSFWMSFICVLVLWTNMFVFQK